MNNFYFISLFYWLVGTNRTEQQNKIEKKNFSTTDYEKRNTHTNESSFILFINQISFIISKLTAEEENVNISFFINK